MYCSLTASHLQHVVYFVNNITKLFETVEVKIWFRRRYTVIIIY